MREIKNRGTQNPTKYENWVMTYHEIGESTMNANLMTKKIEMSKNEAKAAGKIGTAEFEMLREYMAACQK